MRLSAAAKRADDPLVRRLRFPVWFGRLAVRRARAWVLVGLLCLVGRLAVLPLRPVPLPAIHDEFSYLLAADTFALGRATNPPHPLWVHFETFHEIQQPTYASKYPPLQGLVLAAGQIAGHPWLGVWISMGLMCTAMCWMLQGWLPPRFALLGAMVAVTEIGIASYWMDSYWGGAVAAIGGALLLGAFPRLLKRIRIGTATAFAVGAAILMLSRPFEGLVLALPATIWLAVVTFRRGCPLGEVMLRGALPMTLAMGAAVVAMGWYNWRVTGSTWTMPYAVYQRQYAAAPVLPWMANASKPVYRHEVIRKLWEWDASFTEGARRRPLLKVVIELLNFARFFGPPFLVAMVMLPACWKVPRTRPAVGLLAVSMAGLLSERYVLGHYAAPVCGLFFPLFIVGMVRLSGWKPGGRPVGVQLAAIVFVLIGVEMIGSIATGGQRSAFASQRADLIGSLERRPGDQLVIVRYGPQHVIHDEWVYNRADIDRSKIVWAREMGGADDIRLRSYFRGREAWLLEPDQSPIRLTSIPAGDVPTRSTAIPPDSR